MAQLFFSSRGDYEFATGQAHLRQCAPKQTKRNRPPPSPGPQSTASTRSTAELYLGAGDAGATQTCTARNQ